MSPGIKLTGGYGIEMRQESLDIIEYFEAARGNVLVRLALSLLPCFGPKPRLVGISYRLGMELDHAVFSPNGLKERVLGEPGSKLLRDG